MRFLFSFRLSIGLSSKERERERERLTSISSSFTICCSSCSTYVFQVSSTHSFSALPLHSSPMKSQNVHLRILVVLRLKKTAWELEILHTNTIKESIKIDSWWSDSHNKYWLTTATRYYGMIIENWMTWWTWTWTLTLSKAYNNTKFFYFWSSSYSFAKWKCAGVSERANLPNRMRNTCTNPMYSM